MISAAYLCVSEIFNKKSPAEIAEIINSLPDVFSNRVKKKQNEISQKQTLAAIILALDMLKDAGLDIDMLAFEYKNGRPYIKNRSDIDFNLSHSDDIAICALEISDGAKVGIDIEKITSRRHTKELATRFFSPLELECFLQNECSDLIFTRIWTRKEALLKLREVGLSENLRETDTFSQGKDEYFSEYTVEEKYIVTLCHRDLAAAPRFIKKKSQIKIPIE